MSAGPATVTRYHHGNLRAALLDAALAAARAGGPDGVGLRSASRTAGVSHNAAYRHFADRDALLRAVCEECMSRLADLMEDRMAALPAGTDAATTALARLEATGRAYIEFAVTEPGWFRTAFSVPRDEKPIGPDAGVGRGGLSPYQLLGRCLDELVTAGVLPADRREGAEFPAWAAVHGLSALFVDGPLREASPAEREQVTSIVTTAVIRGL